MMKSNTLYYVALALMVINVLGYVSVGSVECVIVFAIATYLSNMYTKNRSLDILIGLFVSNIVFGCGRVKEGLEMKSPEDLLKKAAAMSEKASKKAKTPEGAEAAKDVKDVAEEAAVFVASKEACCDDNGRLSGLDAASSEKCDAGNFCM